MICELQIRSFLCFTCANYCMYKQVLVMDDIKIPLPIKPIRFLDQLRAFIRLDGKSYATENTYLYWVKQFIHFHKKQHPREMGVEYVEDYLSHLALQRNSAPSTQKTALNALAFLYNRFLQQPLAELSFQYARKTQRTPTVFTHDEALRVIELLPMPHKLIAQLMYGSGLRISEAVRLRVKDVDFAMGYLVLRNSKGDKDRTTLLPKSLIESWREQVAIVEKLRDWTTRAAWVAFTFRTGLKENIHVLGWRLHGNMFFLRMMWQLIQERVWNGVITYIVVRCKNMLDAPYAVREFTNRLVATPSAIHSPHVFCKPNMT
jgi:integrase